MPSTPTFARFNVTEAMGTIPGLYSDGTHAHDNSVNLKAMIQELLTLGGVTNGQGGTLLFPSASPATAGQASYLFDTTIPIGPVGGTNYPFNIILQGEGAQSRAVPLLQMTETDQDFFVVNNQQSMDSTSDDQIAGIVFEDLMLSYAVTEGLSDTGRGIVVQNGSNVRVQRVTFDENPGAALHFEQSLYCSIIDCKVRVEKVSGSIGLSLGDSAQNASAIETYVTGTLFGAYSTGGIGLQIYGAEHLRMTNCRFEGWTNGIIISPQNSTDPARKLFFGNVSCFTSNAALTISASGGSVETPQFVAQLWFAQCEFEPGGGSTSYNGAGIIIEAPASATDYIDQIRFVDCFSCFWAGPGMNIEGGTNVEIIGGYYSCNGNNGGGNAPNPYSKSGIAVSGACDGLRISSAACNNSLFDIYANIPSYATATQKYGIYVGYAASNVKINGCELTGNLSYGLWIDRTSGGPTNVFAKHCDLNGNTTGAVQVTTPVTNVQIADCPGYNDQNTAITPTSFTSTQTAETATNPYYGPSVLTWSGLPTGGTSVLTLNSVAYNPGSVLGAIGSVYLLPFDTIRFNIKPPTINWVGK